MRLYHFTSLELSRRIDKEGLIIGGVYIPARPIDRVYPGFIWLTDDPIFKAQNWATNHTGLVGNRTEVRYTVEVTDAIPWNEAAQKIFNLSRTFLLQYNLMGGSDGTHWYLYKGGIPVSQIIEKIARGTE
jgi:hypothetical protein